MASKVLFIAVVSGLAVLALQQGVFEEYAERLLRIDSYPDTFIRRIELNLSNPPRVRLVWAGPDAAQQPVGPFRASPGRGCGTNNCNDVVESNCPGSLCTPKGTRVVEALEEHLKDHPECRFATVIDRERAISFHAHEHVPDYPSSSGCIRMSAHAAQLIHNNCRIEVTEVVVDGEWSLPLRDATKQVHE